MKDFNGLFMVLVMILLACIAIAVIQYDHNKKVLEASAIENGLVEYRLKVVDEYVVEFSGRSERFKTLVNPYTRVMYTETSTGDLQELHDADNNLLIYKGPLP